MKEGKFLTCIVSACISGLGAFFAPLAGFAADRSITMVKSNDGVSIAVECAGAGPSLVIVHGGTGDRSRWTPLLLLLSKFSVCALDRRGHGASGDSSDHTLQKEAEDVAAVVNSRSDSVFVLFVQVDNFRIADQTSTIRSGHFYR